MLYYAQGRALITDEELAEQKTFDQVRTFYTELLERKKPAAVKLSTGDLTLESVHIRAEDIPFQPIGTGMPLTVMITELYTGKHRRKDMLVTSAVKSITSFDAKPRALNFLVSGQDTNARLSRPKASDKGTPFLFYSPALLEKSLTLDLAVVFDNFPQEVFNQVGDIFTGAAGIPLFLPYATYIIGAGLIAKLVGKIGEAIFDGKPTFTSSDGLDIAWPGKPALPPGYRLVTTDNVDNLDPTFRKQHNVSQTGTLVDSAGKEYQGDIPYLIISVDGTRQDELAQFTPTAASAAVVNRFFGMKDGQQVPLSLLTDAIKLYNDLHYRQEVDRIDKELAGVSEGSDQAKALKEKRTALRQNIFEDLLKPKA